MDVVAEGRGGVGRRLTPEPILAKPREVGGLGAGERGRRATVLEACGRIGGAEQALPCWRKEPGSQRVGHRGRSWRSIGRAKGRGPRAPKRDNQRREPGCGSRPRRGDPGGGVWARLLGPARRKPPASERRACKVLRQPRPTRRLPLGSDRREGPTARASTPGPGRKSDRVSRYSIRVSWPISSSLSCLAIESSLQPHRLCITHDFLTTDATGNS